MGVREQLGGQGYSALRHGVVWGGAISPGLPVERGGHFPWVELGPGCPILFRIALKHPRLLCSILDGSGVVWKGLDMTGHNALILLIY